MRSSFCFAELWDRQFIRNKMHQSVPLFFNSGEILRDEIRNWANSEYYAVSSILQTDTFCNYIKTALDMSSHHFYEARKLLWDSLLIVMKHWMSLLLSTILLASAATADCPDSLWVTVGGSCYKVSSDRMNWNTAQQVKNWCFFTFEVPACMSDSFAPLFHSTAPQKVAILLKSMMRMSRQVPIIWYFSRQSVISSHELPHNRPPCPAFWPRVSTTGLDWVTRPVMASLCGNIVSQKPATPTGDQGSQTIMVEMRTVFCWYVK